MRLVRYRHNGVVSVGCVEDESVRTFGPDFKRITEAILEPARALASAEAAVELPREAVTLLAPVDESSRIFAVAQNYSSHAQEISGTDAPPAPIIFLKPPSAMVGADEPIRLPPVTSFLDYEAELAVVIGQGGRRLAPENAAAIVCGATCFNDVTGRDLQAAILGGKELVDWFSAKSLDSTSPLGPWIVSRDEIRRDLSELTIRCRVNGETVQEDSTSSMVRSIAELLSFISHRVALRPGDVLATGTPGGVGRARGVNLKPGDVVEVEIDGIGTLKTTVSGLDA